MYLGSEDCVHRKHKYTEKDLKEFEMEIKNNCTHDGYIHVTTVIGLLSQLKEKADDTNRFFKEWEAVTSQLKHSKVNLNNIPIVCKETEYGHRTDTRDSENNT